MVSACPDGKDSETNVCLTSDEKCWIEARSNHLSVRISRHSEFGEVQKQVKFDFGGTDLNISKARASSRDKQQEQRFPIPTFVIVSLLTPAAQQPRSRDSQARAQSSKAKQLCSHER